MTIVIAFPNFGIIYRSLTLLTFYTDMRTTLQNSSFLGCRYHRFAHQPFKYTSRTFTVSLFARGFGANGHQGWGTRRCQVSGGWAVVGDVARLKVSTSSRRRFDPMATMLIFTFSCSQFVVVIFCCCSDVFLVEFATIPGICDLKQIATWVLTSWR